MNYAYVLIGLLLLFIVLHILTQTDTFQINKFVSLVFLRGLTIPDRFWWSVSEMIHDDLSGAKLFLKLERNSKNSAFQPISVMGSTIHLVLDPDCIREILDNSPFIFGVGNLKYDYFKSFMRDNVGVSNGCPWKFRRLANEQVLFTDRLHPLRHRIAEFFNNRAIPTDFDGFSQLGKELALNLVLGGNNSVQIFEIFREANSVRIFFPRYWYRKVEIPSYHLLVRAIDRSLKENRSDSLLGMAQMKWSASPELRTTAAECPFSNEYAKGFSKKQLHHEILQQLPHWLFPINGVVTVTVPRVLAMLCQHPDKMRKVIDELFQKEFFKKKFNQKELFKKKFNQKELFKKKFNQKELFKKKFNQKDEVDQLLKNATYLRRCIIETLRLNNTVVSMFRTLLVDHRFKCVSSKWNASFKRGTNFLILIAGILRNPKYFSNPDQFIPERWNDKLENSYANLIWSQGPQRCPGKSLSITIIQIALWSILGRMRRDSNGYPIIECRGITPNLNPHTLNFVQKDV